MVQYFFDFTGSTAEYLLGLCKEIEGNAPVSVARIPLGADTVRLVLSGEKKSELDLGEACLRRLVAPGHYFEKVERRR
jgi:hypothetical protein